MKHIRFTNNGKRADFGGFFGEDSSASGDDSSDVSNEQDIDSETEGSKKSSGGGKPATEQPKEKESSGGLLDSLGKLASAGLGGGLGSLCGCANKDKQAEDAKKQELSQKYPLRDCGPTPTQECITFNQQQLARQKAEYDAWQAAKDAQVGAALPVSDKQNFATVNALARQLKAQHPETGSMTLAQIYKTYPDDFDKIYAQLQQVYPFLKNIDPATALAMNPDIANMTLDQLITKTAALSGGLSGVVSGSKAGGGAALGILALAAGAAILLFKKR